MSGYIGNIPTPQATQSRQSFTATASQTTFATVGYTAGFIDVYLNGVHLLDGTDYTATNGSDIVLTTGAALNDVVEFVAYSTYEVNSQNYTGGLTVDNTGATVLTVDRATSDGDITTFQKDGTTVGNIGVQNNYLTIGKNDTGLKFQDGVDGVHPWDMTSNAGRDAAIDIGYSANRFRNLYLSGGIYLGGTGAANKLDDYEEGTWTPTLTFGGANVGMVYGQQNGTYTKVGNMVTASCYIYLSVKGTSVGQARINGLPFVAHPLAASYTAGTVWVNVVSFNGYPQVYIDPNSNSTGLGYVADSGAAAAMYHTNFSNGSGVMVNFTYRTDA